jgi:hypothetical protein
MIVVALFALAFAFMAVPGVSAACGDAAGPGVDWSGCNKGAVNVATKDMTGANLTGANLAGSNFTGTILVNAQIDGVNFAGAYFYQTNFTGATGTPSDLAGVFFVDVTCPDGTTGNSSCTWTPAAVTLTGAGATSAASPWPLALAGMLLLGTLGVLVLRRDEGRTAVLNN